LLKVTPNNENGKNKAAVLIDCSKLYQIEIVDSPKTSAISNLANADG